jgi:hypothetical protein
MFRLFKSATASTVMDVSKYGKDDSTDSFCVDPLPELKDALLLDALSSQLKETKIIINVNTTTIFMLKTPSELAYNLF